MLLRSLAIAALLTTAFAVPATVAVAQENSGYVVAKKKSKPLKGVIYGNRRRGGYSYGKAEIYESRKFVERKANKQSDAGPFDSGFFFETPWSPHGGTAPYMH